MECTHWLGSHMHWFWIMPLLFMILMLVFATLLSRRTRSWRCCAGPRSRREFPWGTLEKGPTANWCSETPHQILDQRYARGDLTKDQYEQMKRDIESSSPHSGPGDGVTRN